jgi:hypothetical protein
MHHVLVQKLVWSVAALILAACLLFAYALS